MKKLMQLPRAARILKGLTLLLGLCAVSTGTVVGQAVQCPPNVNFENGDLTNWLCYIGRSTMGTAATGPQMTAIVATTPLPGRHEIVSGPALDPYGGFPVLCPGGGTYSLKLGNNLFNDSAERVRYYVHVPVGFKSYSFNFRYAAVLENGGHELPDQPTFRVAAYDSATGVAIPCATLTYVVDKDPTKLLPGFKISPINANVSYLSWSGGALPLTGQGGKTIIVEVTTLDCDAGGHFGYGYFDVVACGEYKAAVSYCNLDSGFVRFIGTGPNQLYNWYDSKWNFLGQGFYINVPVPKTPDYFYGVLVSSSTSVGCLDTITTDTVSDFMLNAIPAKACVKFGSTIQLNAQTTGGVGGFTSSWDPNPDLSSTTIANPIATPNDTTKYFVTVSDKNGCFRRDTVEIVQAPDAGPDLKVCPLGERPAQLHVAGPASATYTWYDLNGAPAQYLNCTVCQKPVAAPVPPVYTYVVGTNLCSVTDTIVVYHDTSVYIDAPQDPLIVCRPTYVQLFSEAHGLAPLANLPCGTANPIQCLAQDQDTATIGSGVTPPALTLNTPFLADSTFQKYQFIIPKRDLLNAGLYSGTINAMAFRSIAAIQATGPMENVTISLACVPYDTFAAPITNGSFATGTIVATLSSYTLTSNDWNQINFATPYSWDTTTNLLVDICVGPMTARGVGGHDPVAMTDGMVIQKISNTINVCGGNATILRQYAQRPVVEFMYCPSPELPFVYAWQPGTFLSDSTTQNPMAYIPRSIDYAVYTVGRNGCLVRDSLHVIVPVHTLDLGPIDTFACLNQPVYMRAGGADAYQWYEVHNGAFTSATGSLSCDNCTNPVALPQSTTTYAVVYTNNVHQSNPLNSNYESGCPDTLFTTVHIQPLPPVRSSNRDTTIAYGKSVQLFATGASNFTWTPVSSLSDPNSPAPIATPRETTNYIVTGMDSNGCVYRDTVKVIVNYRDNLLIPTGFTPNGDGRNDEFRIINASFQRLMEFRVFNRWGQEIFTTTEITKGWDGKWKGVPQDMGSYQYLIRVAYPDGNVETYKGDVSLIK